MIFKTTDDGGLTNIFKELKAVQVTFEELDKTTLRNAIKAFNNTSISVDDLSKRFGGLDNSVVEYLNNTERGQASMDGLSKSIDNSATSMISATAKAKILAVALNALTGLAISLAIKGITWAVDELIVTLDEQKEKLDEAVTAYEESKSELEKINDELQTTASRIDELNGKDNLTFTEQDELEKLIKTNNELERKIYLLEQANKEAEKEVANEAQNTYDKYTNNRELNAIEQIDFYTNSSLLEGVNWDTYKNDLSWLIAQYRNQQEVLVNAQSNGWKTIEEQAKSNLILLEGYMSEASLDYQNLYGKISGLSDYAMTDELKMAKQDLDDILDVVADILGYGGKRTEDDIKGILAKVDFQGYENQLIKLGESGSLSVDRLKKSFPDLIKYLNEAGISAEELYQYIMAIANPNALNYDELRRQLMESSGIRDGQVNGASDAKIYGVLQSSGVLSNEGLEAYLTVKSKFTDGETEFWSVDDWIYHIQNELKQVENPDEITDSFSYDKLSDIPRKLAEVENAYKTAQEALDSYNEKGYYSLDVIDSILSLEDEYINVLVDQNGQLQINESSMNQLAKIKIEAAKASIYQETCEELVRIKTLDTSLAAQELALVNGTLTESAYKTAKALYEEVVAMGGANAALANNVWDSATKKVKLLDNQLKSLNSGSYNVGKSAISDSAKKATKDAEQATKDYIDSYMNYMEKSLESGRIDYQTYSRDVAKFLKDMYDQGKIAAKDYHDYTKQMLEVQKDAMDSVISAVTNRLDKEIDFYEDQIDAVEERYQTEIDYLDTVIEYYEEQKKSLQDTNDELDRQKALEEALYNLHQKQTQKTIGLYTADKGKIYTTDASAIRDAEDNVRKAKLDIEIAKLDEAIEKVEQQQDALRDAMDKEKEQLQEIIDRLEEYKEQWQNVAKEYEIAQNEMMASQILGADWESQILSGRIDTLNTFAQNYIAIQQAIADAAWASANAQIEAAREAQKGANGNTGGAGSVGSVGDKTEVSTRYKVVDESGKTLISYSGNNAQSKAESYKDRLDDAVHDLDKVKVVKYATGTKHAKKGLNLVGEDGTETFIDNDGNVSLVTKPSLIPMEGGEIVKNEKETKSLLDSMNLVPVQTGDIWKKFAGNMPDLSSMIKVNTPDYSKISGMVSKAQTIEQHNQFNVTLPNITDSTKATKLFEELQRLPLEALQYANTRKK